MKLYTIFIAAVAVAASPVMAQTQLEQSVGVPAGSLTVAEIFQLRNAMEQDNRDASTIKIKELKERAEARTAVTRNAR